jgi:transposase
VVGKFGGEAFIPFDKEATGRARGSALWSKMYHYFMFSREEFLEHYHKRSNFETVFQMIKTKFGDYIRSKDKTAQINEVLLKVLCHNICVLIQEMHELGIEPQFGLKSEEFVKKVEGN